MSDQKFRFTATKHQEIVDELKKLNGLPPYDGPSNYVRGDGYFAASLEAKYGASIAELEQAVGFDELRRHWEQTGRDFECDDRR